MASRSPPASASSPPAGVTAAPVATTPAATTPAAITPAATATASAAAPTEILPADHWSTVPVRGGIGGDSGRDDDNDSSLGDDDDDSASSTASLASSVLAYRTINGRTYHSERGNAAYWAANDNNACQSLDLHHHLMTLSMDGKLYLSPLDKSSPGLKRALDIGTGTGVWAIDFADENPTWEVVGTDISPIQPDWVPPNLIFEIDDCTQDWTFKPDSFDFVHLRLLYGSVRDWPQLFAQAFRACKLGGWVESFEASAYIVSDDGTVPESSALGQWGKLFVAGGRMSGRTFEIIENDVQAKAMEAAGFREIQVRNFKSPIGAWPKDPKMRELGLLNQATLDKDFEGYVSLIANMVAGWGREEVTVYCANLRREVRSPRMHPYYRQRAVWGRKSPDCGGGELITPK